MGLQGLQGLTRAYMGIYDLFHMSLTLISFTGTYEATIDLLPTSVAL